MRVAPGESPPLWLIAPFFLAAPAGLIAAGLLLASSDADVFVAINLPRTVAVTHALVIGWLTTSVMGATYQLVPAVLGGRLLSTRLAAAQFLLHVAAVPLFVWSLLEWNTLAMSAAGTLLAASLLLYALNASVALLRARSWSLPRAYLLVSLAMLVATLSFGLTYVGSLEEAWFPITMGRLSAHAHLGLVGWLGLTVMGVSYQLVPMFNIVHRVSERAGWWCLAWTALGVVAFAGLMLTDPPAELRVLAALALATGPAVWAADQARLMWRRSRRKLDVQGRSTILSLGFLGLTAVVALGAAVGTPGATDSEPARWLLAYAALGIVGWMGMTLVGNTYKILPFLIWFHRYRPLIGRQPVPMTGDLYSDRVATGIVGLVGVAAVVLATGALAGNFDIFRLGGAVLALAGVTHWLVMLRMFLPRRMPVFAPASPTGAQT